MNSFTRKSTVFNDSTTVGISVVLHCGLAPDAIAYCLVKTIKVKRYFFWPVENLLPKKLESPFQFSVAERSKQ